MLPIFRPEKFEHICLFEVFVKEGEMLPIFVLDLFKTCHTPQLNVLVQNREKRCPFCPRTCPHPLDASKKVWREKLGSMSLIFQPSCVAAFSLHKVFGIRVAVISLHFATKRMEHLHWKIISEETIFLFYSCAVAQCCIGLSLRYN